jgi:adenylate kinase family enzyme
MVDPARVQFPVRVKCVAWTRLWGIVKLFENQTTLELNGFGSSDKENPMKRVLAASVLVALVTVAPASHAQTGASDATVVSTWTLVSVEKNIASGEPTRQGSPRGLLVLDHAGYVFEYFSSASRNPGDSPRLDPLGTLDSVGGFWGRYEADPETGQLHFEANDGISPSVRNLNFSRSFELTGDRLVVTSTDEPQAQGDTRWTWQRVPTVENLSPVYREVAGFWQHIEERRVDTATGEVQNSTRRAPSVIVYTPGGFVGVHFPTLGRESFAGAEPTEDEAQAAVRGYLGYFGTLNVYPGEVAHNVLSGISPTTGSILRRYAEITGDELIVTLQSGAARTSDNDRPDTVCGGEVVQRGDDTPEAIQKRLDLYERETAPLIAWYKERDLLQAVDGLGPADEVTTRLVRAIDERRA